MSSLIKRAIRRFLLELFFASLRRLNRGETTSFEVEWHMVRLFEIYKDTTVPAAKRNLAAGYAMLFEAESARRRALRAC